MAIYRRGEIWHYDFAYKGERHRGSTEERHEGKARTFVEDKRDKLRAAHKLGASPARDVVTLKAASLAWFDAVMEGRKSADDTVRRLAILFRHMDPNLPVSAVGPREINAALQARRVEPRRNSSKKAPRAIANGTVNRDMIDSTLRPILNFAASTLEEPVRKIDWTKHRLKEPPGRTRTFTASELDAWRGQLPEWHRPLFDFLGVYGLRLDEAFFPPASVDPAAGIITVYDTKNGTDHQLPIHDDDMPDLAQRARRASFAGLDTIWFKDKGGKLTPIRYRGFQSASATALKRAKVANARPAHDLRHHAATTLYRASGSILLVQDLLNHKTVASSARYAHTNKTDLREAMKKARVTKAPTKDVTEPENTVEST